MARTTPGPAIREGDSPILLRRLRKIGTVPDAATEFQVQGLELDWVCVAWDGGLRRGSSDEGGSGWNHHFFRGDRWCNVKKPEDQRYLCNAYRVLLTRARQGMVLYVPKGDPADPTRAPAIYDATYRYLAEIGIPDLT